LKRWQRKARFSIRRQNLVGNETFYRFGTTAQQHPAPEIKLFYQFKAHFRQAAASKTCLYISKDI